ncbi:MAG TPA: hypothetical protein DG753_06665 [Clostridium sp.]|nr:hypothetical protein [Clostridium sp.]
MQIDKCIYCSKDLRCKILNVKKCTEKGCSFYKNKEMQKESISKSYKRLNTLDKKTQSYISSKYYGGKRIWIR